MTGGAGEDLLALDRRHLWHPYSPAEPPLAPLEVAAAEGVRLRLADGRELIDGMSSWWCAIHGYRNRALDAALADQAGRMSHVMFGGLTHGPAVRLATRLVELTPEPLQRVFFADSGSVAVEVAIKICLQRALAAGHPERRRLLTVRGGYHGDTFGAMAVCDPVGGMHSLFTGTLVEHVFADRPPAGLDTPVPAAYRAGLRSLAERHRHELAGVIVEPVLQGAGGMYVYPPAVLRELRAICDELEIPLVLDEIATGFGRTGALFACEHAGVAPDVLCLGKALTGGYMTLAATLCTDEIAAAISAGPGGALMHGPTFMANPLACAVALASLELLESRGWRAEVAAIARGLQSGLAPARELAGVRDVRVLGAVGVIELEQPVEMAAATSAAVDAGVWLRPFRDLVYTMPPYIAGADEIARICAAAVAAARASLAAVAAAPLRP